MTRLDELLLASGKITADDLRKVQRMQAERGEPRERLLVELGFISEEDLLPILSEYYGAPVAARRDFPEEPLVVSGLAPAFLRQARLCPLRVADGEITVAMADPGDFGAYEALAKATGCSVRPMLARERDILEALSRHFADGGAGGERALGEVGEIEYLQEDEEDVERLRDLASEAPVIRLVNGLISRALESRASDIHVEPFEKELRVRYRIDGILHDVEAPPRQLQAALTSRIKLMAKLNIAERRLPQDGRIKLRMLGREIDLRVSSLPTLYGESVVLRILDRTSIILDLEALGFARDTLEAFHQLIHRPYGMILVTGPTGSGKTTTLYAALDKINSPDKKIITIEDPVEYQLGGVNQIHVKPQIGLSFANGLRSIVRQDPDVIMVGEIRDSETAEIAVQAALTGHLVFSTLHTNDAAGAIARLLEMGVEDYLLASSLLGVLAQRLVRRVCVRCRVPAEDDGGAAEHEAGGAGGSTVYRTRGCEECAMTGYRGRSGIYELLPLGDEIRKLILTRASADAIRASAVSMGMRTLREDGWRVVRAGVTTVSELLRVTQEE